LVEGQAEAFVTQLARELGRDHALAPAIGVAEGSDDVVYALTGEGTPFAVVHLAWPAPDPRPWLLRRLRPRMRRVPAVVPLQRLTDLE